MLPLKKLTPFFAFLIFGSISVFLWQNQNRHERELVFGRTETSSEQIRIRMEGLMNTRMASLESLAQRWVERVPPDFSQKRFLEFAEVFYSHYPGFAGINWIDPTGVVRWVFPKNSNECIIDKHIFEHQDSSFHKKFQILHTDQHVVTPCVELVQGGLGYNTFSPLVYSGKIQGYLNGVFQVEEIVDICVVKEIFADFWVRLYEADRLIYTNQNQSDGNPGKNGLRILREIQFPGKIWTLDLAPKAVIYPSWTAWKVSFLIFGLVISAILSLLLHFLLERMQMYRQAGDQALQEVSERKRTEKALIENEKKLEATLAELVAKNTEFETFMYGVSHDLKTPVVTIEGFISVLRQDFGNLIGKDGKKYMDYMSDAARKMKLLINDLLDLSRIGRLPEIKTEFSFARPLEEALASLQHQITERGIAVHVEKNLPMICGDKKQLGQAMENLVSNAVKYIGKDNPSPRIDVGTLEQDSSKVFFIRDNGVGIEEKYFEKIFEVFQRLPAAKKIGEGTGIGLAIVKRIIEHHGGRVWLESDIGKGTTFFFTLKDKENW